MTSSTSRMATHGATTPKDRANRFGDRSSAGVMGKSSAFLQKFPEGGRYATAEAFAGGAAFLACFGATFTRSKSARAALFMKVARPTRRK